MPDRHHSTYPGSAGDRTRNPCGPPALPARTPAGASAIRNLPERKKHMIADADTHEGRLYRQRRQRGTTGEPSRRRNRCSITTRPPSSHDKWRLTVPTLHLHHAASFLCVGCTLRPSAGVLQTCAQHGHARHGNVEHHRQVEVVAAVRRAGRQQARSGTTGREAAMTPGTLKRFMRSHGSPHPRNRRLLTPTGLEHVAARGRTAQGERQQTGRGENDDDGDHEYEVHHRPAPIDRAREASRRTTRTITQAKGTRSTAGTRRSLAAISTATNTTAATAATIHEAGPGSS